MDFLASSLGFGGGSGGGDQLATCEPGSIPFPTTLVGAEFLGVEAHVVTNYSFPVPPGYTSSDHGYPEGTPAQTFWGGDGAGVPWNGVLQSAGGGVFQTGHWIWSHADAVSEGYAVVSTDGGHTTENLGDPSTWALASEGNVDLYALQNFASVALRDAGVIGKSVAAAFYGRAPTRSYHTGCSTGGRQAAMLAQRWPDLHDGYLAGAPAIYWDSFVVALLYPRAVMAELGYVPPPCEMHEFTRRALRHCDGLDGVEDGVVSEPELCFASFDPRALAGEEFVCGDEGAGGKTLKLTDEGARVVQAVWEGWYETGEKGGERTLIWPGLGHQSTMEDPLHLFTTTCDYKANPPKCKPTSFSASKQWLQYFIHRTHQPIDETTLTVAGLKRALHASRQWYGSVMGTDDADLSGLRASGGKLLLWHGTSDELIPYAQSRKYYESVVAKDRANIDDYLRYFEAPGVGHCGFGGFGFRPRGLVDTLRAWVEEGKAPQVLPAQMLVATPHHHLQQADDVNMQRVLCKYPKRAKYDGKGDVAKAESFRCE